jgi:hypothetical protein
MEEAMIHHLALSRLAFAFFLFVLFLAAVIFYKGSR